MLKDLFHLFYPRLCSGCGGALAKSEQVVCLNCIESIAFCPYTVGVHPIEKIFWGRCELNAATSLMVFNKKGVGQTLLHRLKYQGEQDVGIYLGNLMGEKVLKNSKIENIDAIIPVPLHDKKLKQRGYNQCDIIGKGCAETLGVKLQKDILFRGLNTSSQTRKTRLERVENVSDAFYIKEPKAADKIAHVLLLDDVITTGATLEACINLLSPLYKVSVATLAYQ